MQKRREVRDDIFEPRGFGDFGGFGFQERMMPSLFGGRDPFDDPFFRDPFDSLFGSNSASRAVQNPNREKGIVIEELDSDDEGADNCPQHGDKDFDQKKSRSTVEPSVEYPDDDDVSERKNSDVTYKNNHYKTEPSKANKYSFQSSRVTYGGIDGAYYTSTRTRRMGSNGVVMEENKEADSTTGQATHRISRGIHDKGHSVLRKLDSYGKVDTTQTLHNLNEDELSGFEEAWKGNNMAQLPGFDVHMSGDSSNGKLNRNHTWPLAYLEPSKGDRKFPSKYEAGNNSGGRTKKVIRINIE
ncbi:myeloid leukemia factor 1 isoform X2 [Vigna unguiculata]|uniref:Myeloid leukemia factor n=1 Tax=Vigna unguiculata TaxID=3917 RepID=A0A4D6MNT0_VIGUN|nr:myeloid leukemia factor 1 isoform X2 [Vigna unguiculata]QCE03023.1 Myeloid leukemia factor [Vigna unguiculata]